MHFANFIGPKRCRSLDIPFETERTAEIVYNSLRVDKEPKRGGTKRQMRLQSNVVHVLVPRDLRLAKRWLQEVKVLVLVLFFVELGQPQKLDRCESVSTALWISCYLLFKL